MVTNIRESSRESSRVRQHKKYRQFQVVEGKYTVHIPVRYISSNLTQFVRHSPANIIPVHCNPVDGMQER